MEPLSFTKIKNDQIKCKTYRLLSINLPHLTLNGNPATFAFYFHQDCHQMKTHVPCQALQTNINSTNCLKKDKKQHHKNYYTYGKRVKHTNT